MIDITPIVSDLPMAKKTNLRLEIKAFCSTNLPVRASVFLRIRKTATTPRRAVKRYDNVTPSICENNLVKKRAAEYSLCDN